jgi:hypothetical protein
VSLKIEVDPNHPRIFPSITWLGSETAVFVFREKILDRVEVRLFYYLIFFLFIYFFNYKCLNKFMSNHNGGNFRLGTAISQ